MKKLYQQQFHHHHNNPKQQINQQVDYLYSIKKGKANFFIFLVARAVLDEQMGNTTRRTSSGSTSTLPSRSFRYLQEQYNNGNNDTVTTTTTVEETLVSGGGEGGGGGIGLRRGSDGHMPSRAFKYIQDQYEAQQAPVNRTQAVNNRDDLAEIYNKRKIKTKNKIFI